MQNDLKDIRYILYHLHGISYRQKNRLNHKNYNFLDCDWFKKLLFSTNSLCQVVIGQFVIGQFVIEQLNKLITFRVVVKINQSQFQSDMKQFTSPLSVF